MTQSQSEQIPGYLFITAFVLLSLLNRLLERQKFLKIKHFSSEVQQSHHYETHGGPEREHLQQGLPWFSTPLSLVRAQSENTQDDAGLLEIQADSIWHLPDTEQWHQAKLCEIRFFQYSATH